MTNNTDQTNMAEDAKVILHGEERVTVPDISLTSSNIQSPKIEAISVQNQKPPSHYTSFKVMKSTAMDMNVITELKKKNQEQLYQIQNLNDVIKKKDDEIKELRELARQIRAKQIRVSAEKGNFMVNKAQRNGIASVRASTNSNDLTTETPKANNSLKQREQKNFILNNKKRFDTTKTVKQYGKLKNHEYGPLNGDLDMVANDEYYHESQQSYGTVPLMNSQLSRIKNSPIIQSHKSVKPLEPIELSNQKKKDSILNRINSKRALSHVQKLPDISKFDDARKSQEQMPPPELQNESPYREKLDVQYRK